MNEWPDDKIRSTSLRYINQHAMAPSTWSATVVGEMHPQLSQFFEMKSGESPIVSCFHSRSSWYVLSTRRVIGACRSQAVDVAILDVVKQDFGNFKGYGQTTIELMHLQITGGQTVSLECETGKASMASIYFLRYWAIKYPVLRKLKP